MNKGIVLTWCISTAAIAAVAWFGSLYVSERPRFAEQVRQQSMHSTVLEERREYLVHLPESYAAQPARRYRVIYVLDGSSQDLHTFASAALMARIGVIDEVIVVGIPNVGGAGRQRDYTPPGMRQDTDPNVAAMGEADRFLAFLEQELIPTVEQQFRTSSVRTLAGNSRGGLFVVYAMTARPGLFDAYVANSPALWRDGGAMVRRLGDHLRSGSPNPGKLFISLGSEENDKMRSAFESAAAVLKRDAKDLCWRAVVVPGAGHQDNAEKATPLALQWLASAEMHSDPPRPSVRRPSPSGMADGKLHACFRAPH